MSHLRAHGARAACYGWDGSAILSHRAGGVACHQVFPEPMLKQTGDRWYCLPCHATPKPDADGKVRARSGMPMWGYGVIVALLARYTSSPLGETPHGSSGLPQLITEAAEPWSKMPVEQWPQFTLANEFELQGVPKSRMRSRQKSGRPQHDDRGAQSAVCFVAHVHSRSAGSRDRFRWLFRRTGGAEQRRRLAFAAPRDAAASLWEKSAPFLARRRTWGATAT